MNAINQLGKILVSEPVRVRTKNSVYLVKSVAKGKNPRYEAVKVELLKPEEKTKFKKGARFFGDFLFLEIGFYMLLGDLRTSEVVSVKYVEPHH